jgi:hypothetical protein
LVSVQVLLSLLEDPANPNSRALAALLDVPLLLLPAKRLATLSPDVQAATFKTSFCICETAWALRPRKEEGLGTSNPLQRSPDWSDAGMLLLLLSVGIANSTTLSPPRIPREQQVPGCIARTVLLDA